ncbi:MAG: 5-(carboxyamino)imidazole ribonucleotide mutase [Bdellovibrionales bacterium]
MKKQIPVAIIMGSDSDYRVMKDAVQALKEFDVPHVKKIISAHRTPREMIEFAETAKAKGFQVIIAGAGGSAHLPGMVASLTELPVIGVPVEVTSLKGVDALLSIVQMPKGVPVATVAINGAYNAGLLACKIIASGSSPLSKKLSQKLANYRKSLRTTVLKKRLP